MQTGSLLCADEVIGLYSVVWLFQATEEKCGHFLSLPKAGGACV